ncbi:MAG: signal peptidase I [Acidimicrobiales bacterium]
MSPDDQPPTAVSDGSATPAEDDSRAEVDSAETRARAEQRARSRTKGIVEWILVIGGALLVAFLIKTFLFQAFYIPSESMEPTLVGNDRVIVNKLSYSLHDVNRGDVVVFDRPPNEPASDIDELIKRVIGLGGETIEGRDGAIFIDGRRLVEPYLAPGMDAGSFAPVEIPEGHVFMMGDNRGNSRDSRFFGPIDEDLIVGRAFVRVWPLGRLGFL